MSGFEEIQERPIETGDDWGRSDQPKKVNRVIRWAASLRGNGQRSRKAVMVFAATATGLLVISLIAAIATGMIGTESRNGADGKNPAMRPPQALIRDLREDIAKLVERIEGMEERLDGHLATALAIPEKVERQGSAIEHLRQTLESYRTEAEVLRQGFSELEQAKAQAERAAQATRERQQAAAKRTQRPRPPAAPFELVSIDSWGGETSLVVRARNRLHTLEPNGTLEGWTVDSIDSHRGSVTLRDRHGRKASMKLESP